MTYRNLLLLGLSSIALQGCIAAAALPIVAGSGALVRNGVSDDARSGNRESVTVVNPPAPAAAPAATPTPAPALAAAEPAEPVAAATEPTTPAPLPTTAPTPTPLASTAPEPVIVATLGDVPQGPELRPTPAPPPAPAETAVAAPRLPDEPEAPALEAAPPSQAVIVATLPEEPPAAAPEPAPASEELAAVQSAEEPVATALTPPPPVASIAEVGLPPEPAAPETTETPALAAVTPSTQPPAASAPEPAEPATAAIAEADTGEQATGPAFVSAEPPVEPPAGPSPEAVFGQPATGTGYDALASYALRTLGGGLPLPSAMLADPTSLQPIRRDCRGNAPTVVIDLDPAGGVVPIAGPLPLNNELARILADLRLRNVQVAWITDRGPIDARAVRDRLVASGLDPASQDSLYVERYPGETKQARRSALAQTRCVIALAGDERSDFDDLYNFLRDLNDARSLEMMLGNGWFLIPNPVGG